MTLFEQCVETIEAAVAAGRGLADRIELCADLAVDGLTPEHDLVRDVLRAVPIPVHVMVRTHPGPFTATPSQRRQMEEQLETIRALGAQGVVFGVLLPDGRIDVDFAARFVHLARPLTVTFHRAFDSTPDLFASLDALLDAGVHRVLTSGRALTAVDGIPTLRELVRRARGRIAVMAGGKVRPHNWKRIVDETGVPEVHASVPLKPASRA